MAKMNNMTLFFVLVGAVLVAGALLPLAGQFGSAISNAITGSTQQSAVGGAGGSGSGNDGGSISVFNPSDTVSFTVIAKQKQLLEQGINTTYMAVEATSILDGSQYKTIQVAASNAGGTLTSLPINSPVKVVLENNTNVYTTFVNSNLLADKTKSVDTTVTEFSSPKVRIFNHTDATYAASSANSINLTSMGLTAGSSSQKYTIELEVTDSYTSFGQSGIYVGCTNLKSSTYVVGTDMEEVTSFGGSDSFRLASDQDKDRLWKSTRVNSVSSETGQTEIGYLDIKLKGGQTAPAAGVNCTVYDHASYLAIDGVSEKSGISDDQSVATTVGAAEAHFVWEP